MVRSLAVLFAVLLAGCGGNKMHPDGQLTFGDVQAIHVGLSARQVIDAFGQPSRARRAEDGRIEVLDYSAVDAKGGHARLILEFDAREVLVKRTYTGEVKTP